MLSSLFICANGNSLEKSSCSRLKLTVYEQMESLMKDPVPCLLAQLSLGDGTGITAAGIFPFQN